jgi:hypothetical protein
VALSPAASRADDLRMIERTGRRTTALALLALAVTLATATTLGPLGLGAIVWRVSANGLNQTLGADLAALALVAPASVAAAVLWWRGHPLAPPIAFGVGLATLYYALASVLGADYVQYPGDNERFFLVFLALIVLAWTVAAAGWSAMEPDPSRASRATLRVAAVVLLAGAGLIGVAWLQQLTTIATTGGLSQPADAQAYREAPTAFWLVRIVDLGFIVPLAAWTAFGLWRERPVAVKAASGVLAFMTLQAAAVLAMGLIMLVRGDPTASRAFVVVLTPITAALTVMTLAVLRPMGGRRTPSRRMPARRSSSRILPSETSP